MGEVEINSSNEGIAIIGMSGRFPGAGNIDEFWRNLRCGVDSLSAFTDEDLIASGVDPALLDNKNYVKAGNVLEDIELFDAEFFGFNPREAEITDPQHRFFLECAWEALENAGYNPDSYEGPIGVYAGVGTSNYFINIYSNPELIQSAGFLQVKVGNDKDHLPTRISYKLNLKGPSLNVQTACSTSLVAVHLGCQALMNYECDMALAGGVSISLPQKAGYLYDEGGIASPDGRCRAFDAGAAGTVGGSGIGIVVLKRLADALAEGDHIHAIIRGSAINNDGSEKVGYSAPGVNGQAEVIAMAQAVAGVEPESVTYIETHGTATALGDPIEVAALTQVFRAGTHKKGFCALGSVKTNIGHLDAAAGVTGLIKTVLSLEHKLIPPSLHFEKPNPKIDLDNGPFYVNARLSEWMAENGPRRAGVSSFGIGGTNAHAILEEAPPAEIPGESRPSHLLVLSARSSSALETATGNLADHLKLHPDISLADVAYTLQTGRKAFDFRRAIVCRDVSEAVNALHTGNSKKVFSDERRPGDRSVVFMFPGQGTQHINMGLELYRHEPAFREQVDLCSDILKAHLGLDLRNVLYPGDENQQQAARQLEQTQITQPALFVIEYALAKLWMQWGVQPQAMIGHSIGEYVAACLAGVFSLEDALALVARRARLMQAMPGGAMLAVSLPKEEAEQLLTDRISLAAVNGPALCVVAGSTEDIDELEERVAQRGIECRRLRVSHAFHSRAMDLAVEPFTEAVRLVALKPPEIPFISNVTGSWITPAEATDPEYWAKHLRQTVRFADGLQELLKESNRVLLEAGPGQTLTTLAKSQVEFVVPSSGGTSAIILSSMRHPYDPQSDVAFLLTALGRAWLAGVNVDWAEFYGGQQRQRLPLPTYPFERQRYWVENRMQDRNSAPRTNPQGKNHDIADWFYIPSWKQSMPPARPENGEFAGQKDRWLVFTDQRGLGRKLAERLRREGQDVTTVVAGDRYARLEDDLYSLNPQQPEGYNALFEALSELGKTPRTLVHLWSASINDSSATGPEFFKKCQEYGYYSLLFIAQALVKQKVNEDIRIIVVSSETHEVIPEEKWYPEKATILAPCKVLPQEHTNISCYNVDVVMSEQGSREETRTVDQLLAEIIKTSTDAVVAYRGNQRLVQTFEKVRLENDGQPVRRLRNGGVYLITGGLGRVGLLLAQYLAETLQAKLVLLGRSPFPERSEWERWLETHDGQDALSRKIHRLIAMEGAGAELLILNADVANEEQMRGVLSRIDERFGQLHGVLHAAANPIAASVLPATDVTRDRSESIFHPKTYGLYVLERLLQKREIDFCLLFSSNAAVLGGLGFLAYSAANLFMDAFASHRNNGGPCTWISSNWDGWITEENSQRGAMRTSKNEYLMAPDEGTEAFRRVVSQATVGHIVVSPGDLAERLNIWIRRAFPRDAAANVKADSLHLRPKLYNEYVAPSNDVERSIAEIWRNLLGIEKIGIHDNFFELGGHSLLATQLVSRLREALQAEMSLRTLFEKPTVAELALVVEETLIEEIEKLSEQEAGRFLTTEA